MLFFHKFTKLFLALYVVVLLGCGFFTLPTTDTYYYWTWSQHLQLSYYDGPPLIAYLLWLTTHIFGNTFFAINIISVACVVGSAGLIYKILSSFSSRTSATIAALLWMVYPFATTRFITVSMTLDGLEVLFSLVILWYALRLIRVPQAANYYLLGIAVGLGLLAKYNVIILVVGIMLFVLIHPQLRKLYLNPHLYLAAVLSVAIFSPVIIWNYQHGWTSFLYQLNSHKWTGGSGAINSADKHGLVGMWFYLKSCVFGVLHLLLILMLLLRVKWNFRISVGVENQLLTFLCGFILLFWLYQSYSAHVGLNYMVTVSGLLIMLLAQQLAQINKPFFIYGLLIILAVISLVMQIDKMRIHDKDQANYDKYVKSGIITRP